MRTSDSDSLLRIEDFTEGNRIGNMPNAKISSTCKFRIRVDLLFWSEIRLRDDRFRIYDEICIFRKIAYIMTDMDLESFLSERLKQWRI